MPLITTWHEWNANAGDVMVTWFTSYVNLVMSCWDTHHVHVHGAHALSKNSTLEYLSVLAFMQADLNLGKINTPHFQVLNTQKCK